jgi:succinate dehydrogenase/fumarate reductase flavoprotein subunit
MTRHTIPHCDIPYRCLLPVNIDGLLVAGRCISGSHVAHGVYRVTGTCMAMGQAAGLAAAISAERDISPADLDRKELHQMLLKRGVRFESRS